MVEPIQQACQNIWTYQLLRRCTPRAVRHTQHLPVREEDPEELNTKTDMDSDMIQIQNISDFVISSNKRISLG